MLSNCDAREDARDSPLNCQEINAEYSLEGLMLKLKFQYFGHLMRRGDSLEKTDAGQDGEKEKGMTEDKMFGWHHQLIGYEFEQAPGDGEGQGSLVCCSHGVTKSWTPLRNCTATHCLYPLLQYTHHLWFPAICLP